MNAIHGGTFFRIQTFKEKCSRTMLCFQIIWLIDYEMKNALDIDEISSDMYKTRVTRSDILF